MRTHLVAAALALAACNDCDPVQPIPLPTDQIDTFTQKDQARVDVLWMIDDSGSMEAEQQKIAARFALFFRQLVTSRVDYHIGVVTSDPAEGGALRQYGGAAVDGCDGCRFITRDVPCADPDDVDACPAQQVFRNLVQAGVDGSSFEQGFRSVAMALGVDEVNDDGVPVGAIPAENDGFLRDDASLFVLFVSDEDEGDKSAGAPVVYYQRLFESVKGRGDENRVSVSAITGWPADDALPSLSDVCAILDDDADPRGALVRDVLAHGAERSCLDAAATPDDANARSEVGGRYIELACRTGGVVANLCEEDYSTALDRLGANAAGLARKFPLSRPQDLEAGRDCVAFTADDQPAKLDCNEDGDTLDAADDVLCVVATLLDAGDGPVVVPRLVDGRPPQWTYEPGTGSVRFETVVPAPGTTVAVRYGLKAPSRVCP